MKKFIIAVSIVVALVVLWDISYYRLGIYLDLNPNEEVSTFVKTEEDKILLNEGDGYAEFEIKGVNMGSGMPGYWSTEFHTDKETYLRWFSMIQDMGANVI